MIKKLRMKLIIASMISLLAVLQMCIRDRVETGDFRDRKDDRAGAGEREIGWNFN